MKAQLEFSLPDEEDAFQDAMEASSWRAIVEEMNRYLHKSKRAAVVPEVNKAMDRACAHLKMLLTKYGLETE